MPFQVSNYVITAIPNLAPTSGTINLNGIIVSLVDGASGQPGHLRYRQVLAVLDQPARLVVYDNTAGHALIVLPSNQACIVPQHLYQQAQQAMNTQLGQFAIFARALTLMQDAICACEHWKALRTAERAAVAWLSNVEKLALATSTSAGVSVCGGAAIMTNLAMLGSLIGSGAVGGIAIVSVGPAMIVCKTMNTFEDDEGIKTLNRITGAAGTAAGSTIAVGCVASAGITGLSAPGITTGLCGVGSLLGMPTMVGGLVACSVITTGIATVVVVPVWLGAKAYRKRKRVNQYQQFISNFQNLGYAGPP